MANPQCTACGVIHQRGQCRYDLPRQEITPAICCVVYLTTIGVLFFFILFVLFFYNLADKQQLCYIELFADSVSVSNANVSAADWRIGVVATSPVIHRKISLHTLKSRLLRGDQVISNSSSSSSSEFFGESVNGNKANVVFEKVVMPEVTGDVIWDFRVEILSAVSIDVNHGNGFLMVTCPDISVKFTTDTTTGNVMGSLLGNIRRCDYICQHKLA
ncbi:PREDICTED: uncharacterized protein LOC104706506 [Camelina sativa]|uniref:Uncharacterized protein LOC104706506 n=1 Tax=Camelina sativa TaxID=90675 RepID=A0ABM0T538_CAMSA|nr:PREDICTED: uncharacterized protein LOC104706506 [Camelina sativa]